MSLKLRREIWAGEAKSEVPITWMVLKPGARENISQGEQKWSGTGCQGATLSELLSQAEKEQGGVKKHPPCPQGPEHPLHTEVPHAQRKKGLGDRGFRMSYPTVCCWVCRLC